jgi:tetratricopeptide (TPR) repeat protein
MKRFAFTATALFFLTIGTSARGAGNAARYFDALDAMGDERFGDAISAIDDAIAANNQIGIYYTDRAVALTAMERGPEAEDALHRAAALFQEDDDSRVWTYAWVLMFKRVALPATTPGPPFLITLYAEKLLTAAARYGSAQNAADKAKYLTLIRHFAAEFGDDQFTNAGAAALLARVAHLDEMQRYGLCISLVEKVRELGKQPIDAALSGHSAHSRFALGDIGGARAEFTAALREDPTNAAFFIGRARCEINMGSLSAAQADIGCAKASDAEQTAKQEPELNRLFAAALMNSGDISALLAGKLTDAVAAGKNDDELTAIAERLQRARLAERFLPDEQFAREYCRLRLAAEQDPGNDDKKLDLTAFLIRPTILRKVNIGGTTTTAAVPCGQRYLNAAGPILAAVLRANSKNARAQEQAALLLAMRGRITEMVDSLNNALALGALDLDLANLNLNYFTSVADRDSDKALNLRRVWTSKDQIGVGENAIPRIHTHAPSAADLAEADRLEQESKDLRVQAHNPLAQLINSTQNGSDPGTKAVNALAWARHWEWIGENQKAVGAAVAAAEAEPTNLAALDYLIYLCPKVGVPELGLKYQDQKDSLSNPCPNAALRTFRADSKSGNDVAAQTDLDQAGSADPSSVAVQFARLDFAVHRHRVDDVAAESRLVVAMESGRMRMSGRNFDPAASVTVSLDDARVSILACLIAGSAFEQAADDGQATAQYGRGLSIAGCVPVAEIANPASSKASPLSSEPDLGPETRAVALLGPIYDAHRRCACRLLMRNAPVAALPHCLAMLRLRESPDTDQTAEQLGYLLYQKLGWAALPGPLPARWESDFSNWDQHPPQISASALLNEGIAPNSQNQSDGPQSQTAPPAGSVIQRPDGSRYRLAQ